MTNRQLRQPRQPRQLDLKICEGCGALWLRDRPGRVYCCRCAPLLADMPAPRALRPNSRPNGRTANLPTTLQLVPLNPRTVQAAGGTQ